MICIYIPAVSLFILQILQISSNLSTCALDPISGIPEISKELLLLGTLIIITITSFMIFRGHLDLVTSTSPTLPYMMFFQSFQLLRVLTDLRSVFHSRSALASCTCIRFHHTSSWRYHHFHRVSLRRPLERSLHSSGQ